MSPGETRDTNDPTMSETTTQNDGAQSGTESKHTGGRIHDWGAGGGVSRTVTEAREADDGAHMVLVNSHGVSAGRYVNRSEDGPKYDLIVRTPEDSPAREAVGAVKLLGTGDTIQGTWEDVLRPFIVAHPPEAFGYDGAAAVESADDGESGTDAVDERFVRSVWSHAKTFAADARHRGESDDGPTLTEQYEQTTGESYTPGTSKDAMQAAIRNAWARQKMDELDA